MPLPLAVIAPIALRYGAMTLAAVAAARLVARSSMPARRDQGAEDALDRTPEGLAARSEPGQGNASARYRRVIRLGNVMAVEVDLAALGRLRLRRV